MSMLKMLSADECTPRIAGIAGMLRGILFGLVIMGLCVGASRTEAQEISAEKANFVFYAPGLGAGKFLRSNTAWGSLTIGVWAPQYSKRYPIATVNHSVMTDPEWGLESGSHDIRDIISRVTQDRASKFGQRIYYKTNIGRVKYRTFLFDALSCLGFYMIYNGFNQIVGYYCGNKPLDDQRVKAVLDGLGIKGHGKMPMPVSAPRANTPTLRDKPDRDLCLSAPLRKPGIREGGRKARVDGIKCKEILGL